MEKKYLKIIFTLLIVGYLFSCMPPPKGNFIIEKSLDQKDKRIAKILEKKYYDVNCNILAITQFSRVGCNITDSVRFSYNSKNELILKEYYEPLEVNEETCQIISYTLRNKNSFFYDSQGVFLNYTDSKGRKTNETSFYSKMLKLKDSLGILNDYTKYIYFVKSTLPNKINYLNNNSFSCKTSG